MDKFPYDGITARSFGERIEFFNKSNNVFRKRGFIKEMEKLFEITIKEKSTMKISRKNMIDKADNELAAVDEDLRPPPNGTNWIEPCNWILQGRNGSTGVIGSDELKSYPHEDLAERDMLKQTLTQYKVSAGVGKPTHVQALALRGAMRIAQDIPGAGASKRYYNAFCTSFHSSGYICSNPLGAAVPLDNHNLYEVVRPNKPRRHYFDIEWEDDKEEDVDGKLFMLLDEFTEFMKDREVTDGRKKEVINITSLTDNLFVTDGSRWKKDVYKHSYHVIYRDVIIKNLEDHKILMKQFMEYVAKCDNANKLAVISDYKVVTTRCYNYVYDQAVYTKNRLMRLPGQTKPEMTTPFKTSTLKECWLTQPIPILFCGAANFKPVLVTEKEKNKTYNPEDARAPIHKTHKEQVLDPHKIVYSADDLVVTNAKKWSDVPAKLLRKQSFYSYLSYLSAVIDIINPLERELYEWMSHKTDEKSENIIKYLRNKHNVANWQQIHWNLLKRYGVIEERIADRLDKIHKEYYHGGEVIPYINIDTTQPEFTKRYDIDMTALVEVLRGDMGVGKTRLLIERISQLPPGSKVLYIIGRVHLSEEIAMLMNKKPTIHVKEFPIKKYSKDYVNVEVAVYNSLNKFSGEQRDMVVVDEMVTTMANMKMEKFDETGITTHLYNIVLSSKTKFVDAMFTVPTTLFIRSIYTENMRKCLELDGPTPTEKDILYTYYEREGFKPHHDKREIVPLVNDFVGATHYNETLCNEAGFYRHETRGMLTRMLYEVTVEKKNIAVAVPTKQLAKNLKKFFEGQCKVAILTSDEGKLKTILDDDTVKVFIYTSKVSAGHSIDKPNYFNSIYVVISSVTCEGEWKTPTLDEMIQMTARVRYPITNRIYMCTETPHHRKGYNSAPFCKNLGYSINPNNIPLGLLNSGTDAIAFQLAKLSRVEFNQFAVMCMQRNGFPGSIVRDDIFLTQSVIDQLVFSNGTKFTQMSIRERERRSMSTLTHPSVFFETNGKRKRLSESKYNALPQNIRSSAHVPRMDS